MTEFIEIDGLSDIEEDEDEATVSQMSTEGDNEDGTENGESEEEDDDDELHTVDDDDDERRLEVLKIFLTQIQESEIFDDDDCAAVKKEIKRMENSKRRLWKKQSNDRLKILSEYERVLKLSKFHPSLSNFFIKKHKKMERMIASLR